MAALYERNAKWPEKKRARNIVGLRLLYGKLERGECERASLGDCHGRIEAHHEDYSKPLEITWLCARHHRRLHAHTV